MTLGRRGMSRVGRWPSLALIAVVLVAACTTAGAVLKDVPPAGQVWFGSSFDTETFVLVDRRTTLGANEPFSFVAHLTRSVDAKELVIRVSFNGSLVSSTTANATGTSDVWGFSPGPLFAAGEWRYDLTDIGGNMLATGTVVAK